MFTLLTDAQLEPGEPRGCVPLPVIYENVNTSGPLHEGEPTAVRRESRIDIYAAHAQQRLHLSE